MGKKSRRRPNKSNAAADVKTHPPQCPCYACFQRRQQERDRQNSTDILAPCHHGATFDPCLDKADEDFFVNYNILLACTKEEEGKLLEKIKETFARVAPPPDKNPDEGQKLLVADLYGLAAEAYLVDDDEWATSSYEAALVVEEYRHDPDDGPTHQEQLLMRQENHRRGDGKTGAVIHVSQKIPCNCLDGLKKELKKQGKLGMCDECSKITAAAEQYRCSGCGIAVYCSKACQISDWNHLGKRGSHRFECSEWAKETMCKPCGGIEAPPQGLFGKLRAMCGRVRSGGSGGMS